VWWGGGGGGGGVWRAIILSEVLHFGSWKGYRVWQKSLHKDLITYLTLNHLTGSLFNFLRPAARFLEFDIRVTVHHDKFL